MHKYLFLLGKEMYSLNEEHVIKSCLGSINKKFKHTKLLSVSYFSNVCVLDNTHKLLLLDNKLVILDEIQESVLELILYNINS